MEVERVGTTSKINITIDTKNLEMDKVVTCRIWIDDVEYVVQAIQPSAQENMVARGGEWLAQNGVARDGQEFTPIG